jgi:HK97 gp10 family phage protein
MAKSTDKFEVQGLKELQKQLKDFDLDIMKTASRKAVKSAMEPVLERAQDTVPDNTGALKSTVKLSSGSSDQGQYNRVAWATVKAGGRGAKDATGNMPGNYVLAMHFGTSRGIEETPFLTEAFVPHAGDVANDVKRELTKEVEKGLKKMARRHKSKSK